LVGGACVFQPKRHHLVTVTAGLRHERSFTLISRVHFDLVVSQECIQKAKYIATGGAVHQRVDAG